MHLEFRLQAVIHSLSYLFVKYNVCYNLDFCLLNTLFRHDDDDHYLDSSENILHMIATAYDNTFSLNLLRLPDPIQVKITTTAKRR